MKQALLLTIAGLCCIIMPGPAVSQQGVATLATLPGTAVINATQAPSGLIYYGGEQIGGIDPKTGRSFVVEAGSGTDLAVSPRGDLLAFNRGNPDQFVWTIALNPRTGRPVGAARRLTVHSGRAPAFSPDGRSIAFSVLPATDDSSPRIMRVSTSGGPEEVVVTEPGFAQDLRWSRDGQWIYYRRGHAGVRTIRRVRSTGGTSQQIAVGDQLIGASSDGSHVVFLRPNAAGDRLRLAVLADLAGNELATFELPSGAHPFHWDDVTGSISVARTARLRGVRISGPGAALTPVLRTGLNSLPSFSRDGRQLGYIHHVIARDRLELFDITARKATPLPTPVDPHAGWPPMFSPDGKMIAYVESGAQKLRVHTLADHRDRVVAECAPALGAIQWSSRSDRLMSVCNGEAATQIRSHSLSGVTRNLARIPPLSNGEWRAFAGDSTILVLRPRAIDAIDLSTGARRNINTTRDGETTGAAVVSPDRQWIAVVAVDKAAPLDEYVTLIPLGAGVRRTIPLPRLGNNGPVEWTPDGGSLAFLGEHTGVWVMPLSGGEPTVLSPGLSLDFYGFAPNGSAIVFATAGADETTFMTLRTPLVARRQQ